MYIVVGFRINSDKSVYYAKAKDLDDMAKKAVIAFERRGAQFLSIRCIKEVNHGA